MLRLAIIDDEEETRQIMVNFIDWETYGVTVIGEASDGLVAYDLINAQHPDIVLIDIQMPSMTGLEVLEKGINQSSTNSTRFIIVTNQKIFRKDAKKVSICFEVPHESGSLYHMLSHFIYNNLNMNKIESRPIEERNWEYRFFIDFDGNLGDSAVKNALRGLRDEARNMRILGNY